jgi:Calpain family cysteine protease
VIRRLFCCHTLTDASQLSPACSILGRVGDCWFLSALAVIAERPDLIAKLFGSFDTVARLNNSLAIGVTSVNLFVDGWWRPVLLDNFLPCIIDDNTEHELQLAVDASLGFSATAATSQFEGAGYKLSAATCVTDTTTNEDEGADSSKYNPNAMTRQNWECLEQTIEALNKERQRAGLAISKIPQRSLRRLITTQDMAYSKAKHNQLWVPFLEKAYSKVHGSMHAISGGQIEEAFLDLTGAPTLSFSLHGDPSFSPRACWHKLLGFKHQKLPMGCATDNSAGGIVGMHAYSLLDIVEVKNVAIDFFREKLLDRTLGNVSGFTELDGTVRLLQIRNPHGRGKPRC